MMRNRVVFSASVVSFVMILRRGAVHAWSSRLAMDWPFQGGKSSWDDSLLDLASRVRATLSIPPPVPPLNDGEAFDAFFYPAVYTKQGKGPMQKQRGFANWLIPGRLLVGQYPGCTPEADGPSTSDVNAYMQSLVHDSQIGLFCCLQSEIPAQTDRDAWGDGKVSLPEYLRDDFPHAFTHYAPLVEQYATDQVEFLHYPIPDLSVPSGAIHDLLAQLLETMNDDKVVYLHCWGGRGRTGLVGACLLSLLFPNWDDARILQVVQAAYDTRVGAADMPEALSRSPQTSAQRQFVTRFVQERQRQVS